MTQYPKRWGSNYGNGLDVVAPGIEIPTTDINGSYDMHFFGTSAACPHVAGVAALMLSANPDLTAQEVHDIINATATKLPNYSGDWNSEVGYGLINAEAAVNKAINELSISGADLICDKATYTISSIPEGATITWGSSRLLQLPSQTPPLYVLSGQGTATATIGRYLTPMHKIGSGYTGEAYVSASITLPNGSVKTFWKRVTSGTITKPVLKLNGSAYLYGEPMAPGKIGQTYTFSCDNVDKGKLIWEVIAPGADPYTKTNVSSVSITPVTSGAISVTVTNTDGCPEDNHASGSVVIMPSIVIDPTNPVNPGITINARVWSEGATGDGSGAMTKAAAVETVRVPYEGGYTVELWDDHSMLGRWQREGHVMEIPGARVLSPARYTTCGCMWTVS